MGVLLDRWNIPCTCGYKLSSCHSLPVDVRPRDGERERFENKGFPLRSGLKHSASLFSFFSFSPSLFFAGFFLFALLEVHADSIVFSASLGPESQLSHNCIVIQTLRFLQLLWCCDGFSAGVFNREPFYMNDLSPSIPLLRGTLDKNSRSTRS